MERRRPALPPREKPGDSIRGCAPRDGGPGPSASLVGTTGLGTGRLLICPSAPPEGVRLFPPPRVSKWRITPAWVWRKRVTKAAYGSGEPFRDRFDMFSNPRTVLRELAGPGRPFPMYSQVVPISLYFGAGHGLSVDHRLGVHVRPRAQPSTPTQNSTTPL